MPRITYNQTNFTAGELSPRLYGRSDIERYQNGAKTIQNGVPLIHGGVIMREGTRYITSTKNNAKKSRLIPYVFSKTQSYMLEFGDFYMRVFKDGAQIVSGAVPYEIVTQYTETMLPEIRYVQGADSMFLAHESVPIQRLQRFAHDKWVIMNAPFVTEPFAEIGFRPSTTLTLSAATVGTGRTLTAGASTFLQSDVGRQVTYNGGIALITAYTSGTQVTASITIAFDSTSIAANAWIINGSPQSVLFSSDKGPIGATVKIDAGKAEIISASKSIENMVRGSDTNVVVTITGHGYANGDIITISATVPEQFSGDWKIKNVTANTFDFYLQGYPYIGEPTQLGYASKKTYSTPTDTFRATDVGKYVRLNRGLVKITQYVSPTLVYAEVRTEMDAKVPAQSNAWSLESSVWNQFDGYPRAVSLFEQRLIAGGSPGYPQQFWLSTTAEYLDFEGGINDDDAMTFVISSDQVNPISHISQVRILAALTSGGEFTLRGGIEKPITPTNVQIKNQTTFGCNSVRPVRIGNELFFVQRSGRKVMAFAYKSGGIDGDDYTANDVSVLSEHITQTGIVDMCYQQEPESVLWCVRNDGVIATMTVNREQDVIAWARQSTDGFYESVASIPGPNGDEVYAIVRRTINGNSVRYVEKFDSALNVDCAIFGLSGPGATVWTGLNHLEGKTVNILADGSVMPQQIVAGGQITLARKAKAVQIGLPVNVRLELLTPEVQTGTGSAQGNSMRTSEVTIRFKDTVGCKVNGSVVAFREFGSSVLDQAVPSFSGVKRIETLGWERGASDVLIEHDQPLPFHLLAVTRKFTVND